MMVPNAQKRHGVASWWLRLLLVLLVVISVACVETADTCAVDGSCPEDSNKAVNDNNYVADCRDEDPQCEEWAKAGYCETQPEQTKVVCRKSCPNVCDDGSFDWGEPQEALDEKTKYGIAQTLEYLNTVVHTDSEYQNVRSKCKNNHKQCAYWETLGECDKNPSYMKNNCPASCQNCLDLDFNRRCPWDPTKPRAMGPGDLHKMFERITTDDEWKKYNPIILSQPSPDNKDKDGPWVVTLDDFVSEEECNLLIEAGAKRGYVRSEGGAGDSEHGEYVSEVSDYRTSYQTWCLDECYKDPIAIQISERIANMTGVAEPNSEYLQLLKYEEGQYYKVHHDYIDVHARRPMGPRILTVFLYLNEPEEGGGTNFPKLGDLTVHPKRGRALIWPSVLNDDPMAIDDRTEHEALPVIKGQKYGANAWLHLADFKDAMEKNCHFN